jgi:hypothetical protein
MQAGLATILASGPSPLRPSLAQALATGAFAGQIAGKAIRTEEVQRSNQPVQCAELQAVLA